VSVFSQAGGLVMVLNKAVFLALLCVVSWSFIPVISKVATADITPLQLLFLSNALSALMIGCVLILGAQTNQQHHFAIKKQFMGYRPPCISRLFFLLLVLVLWLLQS
jgi:drug/metabolite transporter (DMT)-like permease